MSEYVGAENAAPSKPKRPIMPTTMLGKWGLALGVLGFAFLVILIMTSGFKDTPDATGVWIMPVIGLLIVDAAAIMNVLALVRAKEQSWVSILALVLTGAFGVFVTMMVVGEGIGAVLGFTH